MILCGGARIEREVAREMDRTRRMNMEEVIMINLRGIAIVRQS